MHEEEAFRKSFDWTLARRILTYVRPYRGYIALALFCLVLTTTAAALTPRFMQYAIDQIFLPSLPLENAERYRLLLTVSLLFFAVRVIDFVASYGQTYLISWVGQHVLYDLRSQIFAKLQRLHLGFFDKNPVGRLMTRVTSDVDAINQFITGGLVGLIADVFLLAGLMISMLLLDWRLALVAFTIMPVLLGVTTWIRTGMRDSYREMRLRLSRLNANLQENLSGVTTTQLFGREPKNEARFDQLSQHLTQAWVRIIYWFAIFFPIVGILGETAVGSVLWFGGQRVLEGAITLGLMVAFVDYVRQMFQPLQDLSDKFNIFQAAMASSERIFGLLDTPEEVDDRPNARPVDHFRGAITFDNVWFAYGTRSQQAEEQPDWDWVLRGVSFRIQPGEKIALVGATGAGKTSVISLVSRFYDVQQGSVRIDDLDVRDYRQRDLRRAVGIVLQDPFLFSGTIEDNLRLGDTSLPFSRLEEVSQFVGAHDFILAQPQGYQTMLHERGGGLSTGQKQLLALTRAILHNPDILLILDEATANVDSETEAKIQQALSRVMEGRTSIVIAHRLSTIRNVDRILVFRKGKLVEEGNHEQLLAYGGYYARLYALNYSH